jgi:selenocysteine lyase/cysteine desulfurase
MSTSVPDFVSAVGDRDDARWAGIATQYPKAPAGLINLEHGYFGAMALPVQAAYEQGIRHVNEYLSPFVRVELAARLDALRDRLAALVNARREEILLTRNATESMQILIGQYARLQPGDAVLCSNLDYPAMKYAMRWLEQRRGVTAIELKFELPISRGELVARYRAAIDETPRLKMMLLSQVYPNNGQLAPLAEIVAHARQRGVDVLVDSAHALGQMPLDVQQQGLDFAGFNLHKWIGAPIGTGFTYIRRDKLDAIEPHFGDRDFPANDIRCRLHSGTPNIGALLAVPTALDFHESLGGATAKRSRLLQLRQYWVEQARSIPGLHLLSPTETEDATALTSFMFEGMSAQELQQALLKRFGIFTVARNIGHADIVRATVALTTTTVELDRFVLALQELSVSR